MSHDSTRSIVEALFNRVGSGAELSDIASLFSDQVDWYIAGDVDTVPWIGKKTGKAGAADFYRQIREQIESLQFEINDMLISGNRAVVLGYLESLVKRTGKVIKTEFAFDITTHENQIIRFRMFEDSFAVAQALI